MEIKKVNMEQFMDLPDRYTLVDGSLEGAPLCPYGNQYQWIGFDIEEKEYVRFTKSVFKLLIKQT